MAQFSDPPVEPNLITSKTAGILGPIMNEDKVLLGVWQTTGVDSKPTIELLGPQTDADGEQCQAPYIVTTREVQNAGIYMINVLTKDPITGTLTVTFENTNTSLTLRTKKINNINVLEEGGASSNTFMLKQSTYTSMDTTDNSVIALSFVNYELTDGEENPVIFCNNCCCSTVGCEEINQIFNIFLIPLKWYSDCPTGNSENTTLIGSWCAACSAAKSLNIQCGLPNKNGKDPCKNLPKFGYTDLKDCKNNYRYQYCPVGTTCMGTCKSACPNEKQVCTFQKRGDGGIYKCIGASGASGTNGSKGTNGSFCVFPSDCISDRCVGNVCVAKDAITEKEKRILIIAGVIVGIILIGIIIYTIFVFRRSDKT